MPKVLTLPNNGGRIVCGKKYQNTGEPFISIEIPCVSLDSLDISRSEALLLIRFLVVQEKISVQEIINTPIDDGLIYEEID